MIPKKGTIEFDEYINSIIAGMVALNEKHEQEQKTKGREPWGT